MATPITWQNINAPDLAAASRPLEAAQRSFSNMFGQFGDILAQRERINEANWQNTKTNNTNAVLDRLASFRTPDELAAAQASGELAQMRQRFGAQIDTAALRGAEEQRLNALRTGARQAGEFQDWSTDRAQAADVEKARQLIANKDFAGARTHLDNVQLRQESALWGSLSQAERDKVVQGQQDTVFGNNQTRFQREGEMHPLELAAKRAAIARERQGITESNARIGQMAKENELRQQQIEANKEARMGKGGNAVQDKAFAEALANSPYSAGSYDTAAGKKALMEQLKVTPEMDQRDISDILYNLDKYFKDGVTVGMDAKGKPIKAPLPVNVIADAVNGSSDNILAVGWSRRGDHVAELIRDRFGIDSDGYQRSDKMSKADRATIEGMQMIKGLEAARLERLKPRSSSSSGSGGSGKVDAPNELAGTAPIGTKRRLKDGSTYQYTKAGWSRYY